MSLRHRDGVGYAINAEPEGEFPFLVRSPTPLRATTYSHDCEAILTVGDGAVGDVFHHVTGKFLAHQRVYVLTNFRDIDVRYLFFYFSALFRLMAQDGSARTTVDSVRRWMLTDMPVAVPPADEQRQIAVYLHRETAQIDTLIEEQQQLIELLKERLAAEEDVLFGDPLDARETTVRRVLRLLSRPAAPGLGVITAFRDGVVTLRSNRRDDGYTFSDTEDGYQEIRPGDLVFHALDGFAGAAGVSDSRGNATPVYHVCALVEDDDMEYVAQLLRYLGRSGFLSTQAPSVRQRSVDFRNWSRFAQVPLSLPPIREQKRVIAHLAARWAKVDTLIAETERFIGLARERRSALITAAVTGQIDVRTSGPVKVA